MKKVISSNKAQLESYGITSEETLVYRYKQYQYSRLQDAVNFASSDRDGIASKSANTKSSA